MTKQNNKSFESLAKREFTYRYCENFSGDTSGLKTPRQTPFHSYANCSPEPSPAPSLLALSQDLVKSLNLNKSLCHDDLDILSGHIKSSNIKPYAHCYGGHQFGHWAGQLGDGRAIGLGQIPNIHGTLNELQLKGAGLTPYSRTADGKAVLRSSLREYLMSEAMHHLGVPSTRALALVSTGEQILRDILYDGHPGLEPGAIVCRVAPNFIRFGHFEMFASRNDSHNLLKLAIFVASENFPEIDCKAPLAYQALLNAIADKTLSMILEWYRIGFTHGVMNTDNMSVLGLTIDYGPFGMLDRFSLDFTPNTSDLPGRRYAFGNQASVAAWNLARLVDCFSIIESQEEFSRALIDRFEKKFHLKFQELILKKMGLKKSEAYSDQLFVKQCLDCLELGALDYTNFFKAIEKIRIEKNLNKEDQHRLLLQESYQSNDSGVKEAIHQFLKHYLDRTEAEDRADEENNHASVESMKQTNPSFILRNHLLFKAHTSLENGCKKDLRALETAILNPYEQPVDQELCQKAPEWSFATAGCAQLSCSS